MMGGSGPPPVDRRQLLGVLAGLVVGSTAGCAGEGGASGGRDADVVAGPDGRLVFEPATVTVERGESVTWRFASAGHNVSCRPGDSEEIALPAGADPFATYGPDESPRTLVAAGEHYTHRFEVTGTYEYVCVPHASADMVGRVVVEG